ncbi:MAG: cytochrome C552 [Gammaproteobacteria bacterium]|nr:cytochrome C552 [Gammaproteobacteria bacterium]
MSDGLFSRKVMLGTSLGAALVFMLIGIIFWGGFNTAMEVTNTMTFCTSCHEMEENVYQEYTKTIHYNNRSGVRATCSDCHVPKTWIHKVIRKIQASNEVLHKVLGTIDTPEKFDAKRLTLAKNVWDTMKSTDSRECRNCHDFISMNPENQKPRSRKQHINGMRAGNTCIDCHKGIAHTKAHDRLEDEELDAISAPDPELAMKELPPQWQAFIDKEAAEKAAPKPKKATAPASAEASAAAATGGMINWSGASEMVATLFYPGQASIEWTLRGKDHGGKNAFKAGDRCSDCHAQEAVDIGQKIVTATKEGVEPTPIPGKRGSVPVTIKAAHDGENLYLRFSWADAEHAPVPFVDGGKMDAANAMKIALMISTDDVEYADRAGCWGTCHADADNMPYAPEGEKVTKYLKESRSKIEIRGRGGKALGGWDKRTSDEEIQEAFDAGLFMDIIRYKAGEKVVEDGYILADRVMEGGQGAEFNAQLQGGQWVVEMKRKLTSDQLGDVSMALAQTYHIGFAIHDDYSSSRFHHVSVGYKLGFDNAEADINALKQ